MKLLITYFIIIFLVSVLLEILPLLFSIYVQEKVDIKLGKKGSIQLALLWSLLLGSSISAGAVLGKIIESNILMPVTEISVISIILCLLGTFFMSIYLSSSEFLEIPIIGEIPSMIISAIFVGGILSFIGGYIQLIIKTALVV